MPVINQKEKRLLWELQSNFPLESRPYLKLAKRVGYSEAGLMRKVRNFKKKGVIRYIGPVFNLKKIGFSSSLIAARLPENKIKKAVRVINQYPNVTHNYLRDDEFNLWFTVTAHSPVELLSIIREIKQKTGISDILNLKTLRVYKIDARFR